MTGPLDRFNTSNSGHALIIYVWAMAQLVHLLVFRDWTTQQPIIGSLVALSSAGVLFSRANPLIVLLTAALSITLWFIRMPIIANHILVEWVFSVVMLVHALRVMLGKRPMSLQAIICSGFSFVYILAAFQKFNTAYLFTENSFAPFLFNGILERLSIGSPLDQTTPLALITIVWELAIGGFLLINRLRLLGIALAILFHVTMALTGLQGVIGFSLMALCYLTVFLPEGHQHFISAALEKLRWFALFTPLLIALLIWKPGWWTWPLITEVTVYISSLSFFIIIWFGRRLHSPCTTMKLKWVLPIIFTLNAVLPYVGHKTSLAFNMFSNLRTEPGYENHLFMPTVSVFQYQGRLVEIEESNINGLQDGFRTHLLNQPARITELGLKQHIMRTEWDKVPRVIYTVGNERDSITGSPELNFYEMKFVTLDLVPMLEE